MLFNVGAAVKCPGYSGVGYVGEFCDIFYGYHRFPFFLYAVIYFYCTINGQSIKSLKLRFCMM